MLGKLINTCHVYTVRMSPALNGSSVLQRFECSNASEIRNGIMFDFYPELPHISPQKPCRRQLNAKVCVCETAIFRLLIKTTNFNNDIGSSICRHFITKLTLTIAWSFTVTQRLHSYQFTLVNKAVLSSARLLSVAYSVGCHCMHAYM